MDDGQVDLDRADYLVIGTLESYEKMRGFYGEENLVPLYVEVEDGERLQRALAREREQREPNMRRCAGDSWRMRRDFSEENLARLGIRERFSNRDKEKCLDES